MVMPQDTRVQLLTGSMHENQPTSDGTDASSLSERTGWR